MTLSSNFNEGEWLTYTFDKLKIGGVWGWPNAKLRYKKISDDKVHLLGVGPFENDNWKEAHNWVVKHSNQYKVEDPSNICNE